MTHSDLIFFCTPKAIYIWDKSDLHLLEYHKSLIFNLQLRNRIAEAIRLLKPGKFSPLGSFEGGFPFFVRITNIQIQTRNS